MSNVMSNILLIALNVLLVGGVIAFVGTLLVRLLRAYLLSDLPPEEAAKQKE